MLDIDFIFKDDLQLTVFIEEKNLQSMHYFYDKYSPALYGIIYRITNNKQLAEECLTTTFVKACNEIATFRHSGTSLFTWLLKLARQSGLDLIKQEKERNSGIHNSVNGQDQHYSAFELVYFKGLSVMQAAELSGITLIELKNNLRMDLQNMKDKTERA
jgi:DNA-directed RNA polymerase specialized sigma24 family protein